MVKEENFLGGEGFQSARLAVVKHLQGSKDIVGTKIFIARYVSLEWNKELMNVTCVVESSATTLPLQEHITIAIRNFIVVEKYFRVIRPTPSINGYIILT